MFRKIFLVVVLLALIGGGFLWLRAGRNTPQAAAKDFTQQLAKGETDKAYQRLTADLTRGREQYWRSYLAQFKNRDNPPTFGKEEAIADTFNTYTEAEDPRRFTYTFHLKGQDYQLIILLIRQDMGWKVDELYGSAVQ